MASVRTVAVEWLGWMTVVDSVPVRGGLVCDGCGLCVCGAWLVLARPLKHCL